VTKGALTTRSPNYTKQTAASQRSGCDKTYTLNTDRPLARLPPEATPALRSFNHKIRYSINLASANFNR
jgi:hypothetical protein